jgi:hypothetical protein
MTFRNRFETKFNLVEIKKFINLINIVLCALRILFLKEKKTSVLSQADVFFYSYYLKKTS